MHTLPHRIDNSVSLGRFYLQVNHINAATLAISTDKEGRHEALPWFQKGENDHTAFFTKTRSQLQDWLSHIRFTITMF